MARIPGCRIASSCAVSLIEANEKSLTIAALPGTQDAVVVPVANPAVNPIKGISYSIC